MYPQTKHLKGVDLLELSFSSTLSVLQPNQLGEGGAEGAGGRGRGVIGGCDLFMLLKRENSSVHLSWFGQLSILQCVEARPASPSFICGFAGT